MRYENYPQRSSSDDSIEGLRQRVKIKKGLADLIQQKCQSAGFDITKDSIYYTFRNPNNYNAEVVKKALRAIIRDQEEQLEKII